MRIPTRRSERWTIKSGWRRFMVSQLSVERRSASVGSTIRRSSTGHDNRSASERRPVTSGLAIGMPSRWRAQSGAVAQGVAWDVRVKARRFFLPYAVDDVAFMVEKLAVAQDEYFRLVFGHLSLSFDGEWHSKHSTMK